MFGSLGNATPFDFVEEVQVKTGGYEAEFGQSMGGVVNVVTKSGTNDLRGSLFGYIRPAALEAGYKDYESPNGSVQTDGQRRSAIAESRVGVPIIRNKLFFFGAINPARETRTFTAPDGFPLEAWARWIASARLTLYSAKATWQPTGSHRIDASFFGDPSNGEIGPQRASALHGHRHLPRSANEIRRPQPDAALQRRHRPDVAGRGHVRPRATITSPRRRSVNDWRVTDRPSCRQITGGIGFYEAGNKSINLQYAVKRPAGWHHQIAAAS